VIYSDVIADPPEHTVLAATQVARVAGCDGILGFGGGSSMDVAKLVAVLIDSNQSLQDLYSVDQVVGGRLPLIQTPTTAGTGSEATAVAIVTTGESSKAGVVSNQLFADHILLDAELTLNLPPHVSAATGIDAMVHAIEAFTNKRLKNPMSDMLALQALKLMSNSIERVVQQGHDIDARSDMLFGAMLAGQAFANSPVAAVHALAYPLGGNYHIPHGLSNSLVLPYVLCFNQPNAGPLYAQIAEVMISSDDGFDATGFDATGFDASRKLAEYFFRLAAGFGLPTSLSALDIPETDLPMLAEQAMLQQRLLVNNPREMSYDDALSIYQQAYTSTSFSSAQ